MKIAVIGAGATGLATAYYLSKKEHKVTIYESSNYIGGHASTFEINGTPIERAYHHWFRNDYEILQLCEEIGLSDQIGWHNSKVGTLFQGKIYNFNSPIDILKYTPLSIIDRFKLGLSTLKIQRIKSWKYVENVTAVEWLKKNAGVHAYKAFWEPMLRGKFGEEYYKEIGMSWVWGKIHTRLASRKGIMSKEKLGYPVGSFKFFFEKLYEKNIDQGVSIHLSTPITKIISQDNKVTGLRINKSSNLEKFDRIICTLPSDIFQKIAPGLNDTYISKLTAVDYMSAILAIIVTNQPISDKYWINIADREIPFLGVIEHTNLIPSSNYSNRNITYLTNYTTKSDPLYKMSDQELLNEYIPHIKKINPNFNQSWIEEYHYHKIDNAQPVIRPNYSKIIPSYETSIENLYLANTTQIYPEDRGTNYSIRMAMDIAKIIEKSYNF
tara:strand:+ start:299 stop:1615 length:1317 start_codon:yes stop_codon:yes gene_type:complete